MKTNKILYIVIAIIIIVVVIDILFFTYYTYNNNPDGKSVKTDSEIYNPLINPSEFSSNVNNRYFVLIPRNKMVYESNTEEGLEKIEVYVMNETKIVNGVETRVVWDRVWLNGDLIEDTKDWYAQDSKGNVWYFGEDSKEMIDGKIINYDGSWESGVNGAKPGIIMKAAPKIGDKYRQEYYKGEAEDMGEVISLSESVIVPFGDFNNCIKTLDYTPLEPDVEEYKFYCPQVGGVVLEVDLEKGERVELVSVEYNSLPSSLTEKEPEQLITTITEEEARAIAIKEINGRVTDISIEKKFGKTTYVVEINNGNEIDVIIDIETGKVLGIER